MADLSGCTILLVDDVKANINLLVAALKGEYRLAFALDGSSALKFAQEHRPDLILLDVLMPGMDGYEVCRRLKADPQTRSIPVIFLTALDQAASKAAGFEAGAVDYVTKPFEMVEVKARVKTHLDLKLARQALQRRHDQMQHSLSLAKEVQQNLIPGRDPQVDGLDIAGRIIYCDETGGDYYDYLEHGGSAGLDIVVGDVSEHGIPSALLMSSARAFLRLRAALPGDLAQIVADVNRLFTRDVGDSGRFMTLFYCRIDGAARRLSWVRAGHDPAWLLDKTHGSFTELGGSGLALGVAAEGRFEARACALEAGQVLILGTDGLWEAANPRQGLFGKSRFKRVIRDLAHLSAGAIADGVIQAVREFRQPRALEDDVTLVVVKIEGLAD